MCGVDGLGAGHEGAAAVRVPASLGVFLRRCRQGSTVTEHLLPWMIGPLWPAGVAADTGLTNTYPIGRVAGARRITRGGTLRPLIAKAPTCWCRSTTSIPLAPPQQTDAGGLSTRAPGLDNQPCNSKVNASTLKSSPTIAKAVSPGRTRRSNTSALLTDPSRGPGDLLGYPGGSVLTDRDNIATSNA